MNPQECEIVMALNRMCLILQGKQSITMADVTNAKDQLIDEICHAPVRTVDSSAVLHEFVGAMNRRAMLTNPATYDAMGDGL
jgi:hypothetical protein